MTTHEKIVGCIDHANELLTDGKIIHISTHGIHDLHLHNEDGTVRPLLGNMDNKECFKFLCYLILSIHGHKEQ